VGNTRHESNYLNNNAYNVARIKGSETYLYLNVAGSNITARVDPRSTARAGDTIKIALDPNRLHFFDKDTEESLLLR
jgi:multiple sugar transport system ATP-binding protein